MRIARYLSGAVTGVAVIVFALSAAAQTHKPGPEGDASGPQHEQVWWVPVAVSPDDPSKVVHLETTVYRPDGDGPFPLAIISHGTPRDPRLHLRDPRLRYFEQSRWFVSQGYAVAVPMRRGYANSEGEWADTRGPTCEGADYIKAGRGGGDDIYGVAKYFHEQSFVDRRRIVLVGNSTGGFGSLAAASRSPEGVMGVVNFSGGHGSYGTNSVCVPDRLVAAFGEFGKTARIPSLWLYAENDWFFGPELAKKLYQSYTGAGAPAEFEQMRSYGNSDGHGTFANWDASDRWVPQVGKYLQGLSARASLN